MGYGCAKTREFFKTLGVESKVEDCGRVFPISDDSRTIAGALERAAGKARLICRARVESVEKTPDGRWKIAYIDELEMSPRRSAPRHGAGIADFRTAGATQHRWKRSARNRINRAESNRVKARAISLPQISFYSQSAELGAKSSKKA